MDGVNDKQIMESIEKFLPFINKLWYRWRNMIEFEDFYQDACIVIMDAIKTYDASKGNKLDSWIYGRLFFKLPDGLRKKLRKNKKAGFTGTISFEDYMIEEETLADIDCKYIPFEKLGISMRDTELFNDYYIQGFTFNEMSSKYKISNQRICQIKAEVLNKIRKEYNDDIYSKR